MKSGSEKKSQLTQTGKQFGKKIGLVATLFGCRHKNLSRPFTYGTESYLACLNCGARRNFNAETMTASGSFYYPPQPSR